MWGQDTSLVVACKAGDPRAWQRLVEAWTGRIYRWAVLLGVPAGDAPDAAQDVLLIASSRLRSCRDDAPLGAWLYQITRRVAANRRRATWLKVLLLGDAPPEPAFALPAGVGQEEELSVRTCLLRLPPQLREVLVVCDIEGLTREEAAQLLRIAPGTVASRLRAARTAFERCMKAEAAPLEALQPSQEAP